MTHARFYAGLAMLLGVCWLAVPPAPADLGQMNDTFTLPRIGVSVETTGGWAVATARVMDQSQRILWRVPLAPATGNVNLIKSLKSVLVEVGNRQFVIDKATGRTRELRPGEVYHDWPSDTSPLPPTAPPPELPRTTGLDAVDRLAVSHQRLETALARLDEVQGLARVGRATPADVQKAVETVEQARTQAREAEDAAFKQIIPPPPAPKAPPASLTPAPGPATPSPKPPREPTPESVQRAQEVMMEMVALHSQAQRDLAQAREDYRIGRVGRSVVEAATQRVAALEDSLASADAELRRARTMGNRPNFDSLSPVMRGRLTRAERTVQKALEDHELAESQLLRTQQDFDRGEASGGELAAAQSQLLDTFKTLTAGRKEMQDLYKMGEDLIRYHEMRMAETRPAGLP